MQQIDEQLIRDSQRGDAAAFARLLNLVYELIYGFALKLLGKVEDAEDLTQQACIKLAKVIRQFRFEAAFTTWLYRLVYNLSLDWRRSQKRHQAEPLGEYEPPKTSGQGEAQLELERVLALVSTMGKGMKETLILVYAEGCTHKQAADILAVKESTVSWRLHEIRKRLKEEADYE
ncbi:RNA polymerase sigma factor [Agaribacterium haliotis]|uniref:RNA polymerase sigma factor n=1 Tax=Agaribacterium haliotis TaxID=2013869 RepID=UPI000BB5791C|nr:RNA polymerase sigma factor [Agaribacterium haliotis]